MATVQPVETLLFDLDDTLYRVPLVPDLMRKNILGYMRDRLHMPEEIVSRGREFYIDYGTTLAGLRVQGYQIDYEDWHAQVHGTLPYEELFQPDQTLRRVLQSLPQPKYIFTNADIKHAERSLACLGIRDLFEKIICFESIMEAASEKGINNMNRPVTCKPSLESFQLALEQASAAAETTLFFDDSARNIVGATSCGIRTVLVGSKQSDTPAIAAIESVHELPDALPELWTRQGTLRPDPHLSLQPVIPEVQVTAQ